MDMVFLTQLNAPQVVIQRSQESLEQSGKIHSKVAGRFEIVKELPKEANSFDKMFDYADAYGKFRLAYIDSAHKISEIANKVEKQATSFGGIVGFKTAQLNNIQFNTAVYISQGLSFINPHKDKLNEDFFARDNSSFAYVAQAGVNYYNDHIQAKIGRISVETPYTNSDDIRMAPNTFEGAWTKIKVSETLNTQFMYLNKWAGYDSQDETKNQFQSEFKNLVDDGSFGMVEASIIYKYATNSEASLWYNYIDKMSVITYGEIVGIYFAQNIDLHLDYGIQASNIEELDNSNIDGKVFGAMGIIHYNGIFFGMAYNIALSDKGKYVTNGFGNGPYYTSLDEATISSISEASASLNSSATNNNAQSYRIGLGYEEKIFLDDLVIEFVYGKLYNKSDAIIEKDIILTYNISEKIYLEATYTNYDSTSDRNTFDRTLIRVDYSF